MKTIIGLGNIGPLYSGTRHNTGFMVVDQLARDYHLGAFAHEKFAAVTASGIIGGQRVMLVKPTTFMNESGRAVKPLMAYYKIQLSDMVVISDDLDLPVGKLRLRSQGSSGGHNGLRSLINHLNTRNFQRIKVGIGRPTQGGVVAHVLGHFSSQEQLLIDSAIVKAEQAIIDWIEGMNFEQVMNKYN